MRYQMKQIRLLLFTFLTIYIQTHTYQYIPHTDNGLQNGLENHALDPSSTKTGSGTNAREMTIPSQEQQLAENNFPEANTSTGDQDQSITLGESGVPEFKAG